jgi:hypothetical protein
LGTIQLRNGREALIDDADAELVSDYAWYSFSVRRVEYVAADQGGKRIYLHRLIARPAEGQEVDHINCDGLDNRRSNLRVCSHAQNLANQRHQERETYSRHKGVTYDKRRGKWLAQAKARKIHYNLGTFKSEDDAARAYNAFAVNAFGEFARLNVIPEAE